MKQLTFWHLLPEIKVRNSARKRTGLDVTVPVKIPIHRTKANHETLLERDLYVKDWWGWFKKAGRSERKLSNASEMNPL
jgi:hypothetical protein